MDPALGTRAADCHGGREDHAAYIANWLDVLKADSRAIFAAPCHAQRAADFINGLQPASSG